MWNFVHGGAWCWGLVSETVTWNSLVSEIQNCRCVDATFSLNWRAVAWRCSHSHLARLQCSKRINNTQSLMAPFRPAKPTSCRCGCAIHPCTWFCSHTHTQLATQCACACFYTPYPTKKNKKTNKTTDGDRQHQPNKANSSFYRTPLYSILFPLTRELKLFCRCLPQVGCTV